MHALSLRDTAAAVLRAVDEVESLSTEQFLELLVGLGELSRTVDALGATADAELTRRVQTDPGFRRAALGGEVGGRAASELMRDASGLDDDTLHAWRVVGAAIAPRVSLQGELLAPRHEPLAEAVRTAALGARHAAVIVRGIDAVADHADADTLHALETTVVGCAATLTVRQLARLVRRLPDHLDPDGAEPREEALRERSRLTVRQLENGMTRLVAELHPEAAGFVLAALDARTAPRRVTFATALAAAGSVADPSTLADTRPLARRRADALAELCREALGRDRGSLAGTSVTMLVTVPLQTLRSGTGTAEIAGVDEPICARTARRLAASAEIIPVVLGAESEVLDLGRAARLFSEAQRRAMVARDGGCVWPGCAAPPAWCEAAHLDPWLTGGPTDLDNGALLCAHHHHRFDRDGWTLRRERGVPYLVPPPWLDPTRTPRRGGRLPAAA